MLLHHCEKLCSSTMHDFTNTRHRNKLNRNEINYSTRKQISNFKLVSDSVREVICFHRGLNIVGFAWTFNHALKPILVDLLIGHSMVGRGGNTTTLPRPHRNWYSTYSRPCIITIHFLLAYAYFHNNYLKIIFFCLIAIPCSKIIQSTQNESGPVPTYSEHFFLLLFFFDVVLLKFMENCQGVQCLIFEDKNIIAFYWGVIHPNKCFRK